MLKLAKQLAEAHKEGEQLGLTADELAFYDALTKPQAIKDFYENEELIAITKELADTLRKNKTIDWQRKESARAKMRTLIKRLLKKHKYPPEGMDDAVQTVMTQCELWTDNVMEAQSMVYRLIIEGWKQWNEKNYLNGQKKSMEQNRITRGMTGIVFCAIRTIKSGLRWWLKSMQKSWDCKKIKRLMF